jgi:hypothetical protein
MIPTLWAKVRIEQNDECRKLNIELAFSKTKHESSQSKLMVSINLRESIT